MSATFNSLSDNGHHAPTGPQLKNDSAFEELMRLNNLPSSGIDKEPDVHQLLDLLNAASRDPALPERMDAWNKQQESKLSQAEEPVAAPAKPQPPAPDASTSSTQSVPESPEERDRKRARKANTLIGSYADRQMQQMLRPLLGDFASDLVFATIHEQYLKMAEYPEHPSIRLLVQQVVAMHFLAIALSRRGMEASSVDIAKVYLNEASKMSSLQLKAMQQLEDLALSIEQRQKKRSRRKATKPVPTPPSAQSSEAA